MSKVLLTGGSGFIAGLEQVNEYSAHILDLLLRKGHRVVTTVRTTEKATQLQKSYPNLSKDKLDIHIVPDIAEQNAFDEVVTVPGLEVVFHTASPFHYSWVDPYTELIEPAVNGTISILNAITHSTAAASVRRVVITSSSAALLSEADFSNPKAVFSESTWNPVTYADINKSKATAYRLSKTMAEKAAWDFVKDPANNAKFDLAVINPPLVFGPVRHHLSSLSAINTSNKPVVDCLTGKWKHGIAPNGQSINYVDVRDIAEAHVRAGLEIPEAGGQRFFPTAGMFCNRDICEIIRTNFPDYAEKLPSPDIPGGEFPPKDQVYSYDNSATSRVLGIKWIHFEQSIVETVKSLKAWGA